LVNNIKRGNIFDVHWNPGRGSEQSGIRPALIIQNDIGNSVTAYPVTIVLAISSKLKGYPAMVRVQATADNGLDIPSEINTGQIITIDKNRLGRYRGYLSTADIRKVEDKLAYMLGLRIVD